MKRLSSRHMPRLVAEISVTPLLDLMLLLLLTVIVLVPVLQSDGMPQAASVVKNSVTTAPKKIIEMKVNADLKLTLAGKGIEPRELITELKKLVATEPELGVVVGVPSGLTAPRLLEIMDALRVAAVRHTSVMVSPVVKP